MYDRMYNDLHFSKLFRYSHHTALEGLWHQLNTTEDTGSCCGVARATTLYHSYYDNNICWNN